MTDDQSPLDTVCGLCGRDVLEAHPATMSAYRCPVHGSLSIYDETTRRDYEEQTDDTPNPGSDEAIEQGCTCPVLDNGHGRGSYRGGFIIRGDCPIHDQDDL